MRGRWIRLAVLPSVRLRVRSFVCLSASSSHIPKRTFDRQNTLHSLSVSVAMKIHIASLFSLCSLFTFASARQHSWLLDTCENNNLQFLDCLKLKTVNFLDKFRRNDVIWITESVSLVKDRPDGSVRPGRDSRSIIQNLTDSVATDSIKKKDDSVNLVEEDSINSVNLEQGLRDGRSVFDGEVRNPLNGDDNEGKSEWLNRLIIDRISKFFETYSLRIGLPKSEEISFQGRGKKKKGLQMIMSMLMMKAAMLIPMGIGMLFLLAGKALILSKIALVLSLILMMKKVFHKGADLVSHDNLHAGWNAALASAALTAGLEKKRADYSVPQNLAYNAYANH